MITKIENGIIEVTQYGFSAGKYRIEDFSADELLEERRILGTYLISHPNSCDLFQKLDDQIARLIDVKCNEKAKVESRRENKCQGKANLRMKKTGLIR